MFVSDELYGNVFLEGVVQKTIFLTLEALNK